MRLQSNTITIIVLLFAVGYCSADAFSNSLRFNYVLPASISFTWTGDPPSPNHPTSYTVCRNGNPIESTKDTNVLVLAAPNESYSYRVCVSGTGQFGSLCSGNCTNQFVLNNNQGLTYSPTGLTLKELNSKQVYWAYQPQDSETGIDQYELQFYKNASAGWRTILVFAPKNVANQFYYGQIDSRNFIQNQVFVGVPYFYRVCAVSAGSYSCEKGTPFATTFDLFPGPQTNLYRQDNLTLVDSTYSSRTNPFGGLQFGRGETMFLKFDASVLNLNPTCYAIYARLSISQQVATSRQDGGFIRVYQSPSDWTSNQLDNTSTELTPDQFPEPKPKDVNWYISNPYAQLKSLIPGVALVNDSGFLEIPLDRDPNNFGISRLINDWVADPSKNYGLLVTLEGSSTSYLQTESANVTLEVASYYPYDDHRDSVALTEPEVSACESRLTAPPVLVPNGATLVAVNLTITAGSWALGTMVDIAFGETLIARDVLITVGQTFVGPQFPLAAGGWPGFNISSPLVVTFYGCDIAIEEAQMDRLFQTTNPAPVCEDPNGITPTPQPSTTRSPSVTPTNSPSVSRSASITVTRSISRTGSGTPTTSRTPTATRSASPSNTATPTASVSMTRTISTTRTPSSSETASRSPSAAPSGTRTPSQSPSVTRTQSESREASKSLTSTRSASKSKSVTPSESETAAASISFSTSRTPSATYSATKSQTHTGSVSKTGSHTHTPDKSISATHTASRTATRAAQSIVNSVPSASATLSSSVNIASSTPSALPTPSSTPTPSSSTPPLVIIDNGNSSVIIPSGNIPAGTTLTTETETATETFIQSVVLSVTLLDSDGNEVQPLGDVELCFTVDDGVDKDKSCLGFFDLNVKPPKWRCQDDCLKQKNNSLCGTTDHFTSFSILFTGTANGCDDNFGNLVFSNAWQDGVLVASVVGFLWVILIIVVLFAVFTRAGNYILRGQEGTRVTKLRKASKVNQPDTSTVNNAQDVEEIA